MLDLEQTNRSFLFNCNTFDIYTGWDHGQVVLSVPGSLIIIAANDNKGFGEL